MHIFEFSDEADYVGFAYVVGHLSVFARGGDDIITASSVDGLFVSGGEGNDYLEILQYAGELDGGAGNDTLTGAEGNDTLIGGQGHDFAFGGGGDDLFDAGRRSDYIDGGEGFDTVGFSSYSRGVWANLALGFATVQSDGDPDEIPEGIAFNHHTLVDIEALIGTDFKDILIGNHLANRLEGNDGEDSLDGAGGNDTLLGGEGDDTISGGDGDDLIDAGGGRANLVAGGAGIDTLRFQDAPGFGGFRIDMDRGAAKQVGTDASATMFSFIENIIGSQANDVIKGDAGDNVLRGFGGFDEIEGRDGNDILESGSAGGILRGGDGEDRLEAHHDAFFTQMEGGADADTFVFQWDTAVPLANRGAILDFNAEEGDKISFAPPAGPEAMDFVDEPFTATGLAQVRIADDGAETGLARVEVDIHGDGVVDWSFDVHLVPGADPLVEDDFIF